MKNLTFANRWNADLIDEYYEQWQDNPASVSEQWQNFFEGFELGMTANPTEGAPSSSGGHAKPSAIGKAMWILRAFRSMGHTQAKLDPLGLSDEPNPELQKSAFDITPADESESIATRTYENGRQISLGRLWDELESIYCGTVGYEYCHIQDRKKYRWVRDNVESRELRKSEMPAQAKTHVLKKLLSAEGFEHFLHTRYVGQKRFSLEGGESFIAAMDAVLQKCPGHGIRRSVIGMAHRGRLSFLANIMGKSCEFIFEEFSENYVPEAVEGDGDVKYHLGYKSTYKTLDGGKVELTLAPNPSHLEAVNPVVQGKARAQERLEHDLEKRTSVLPILVHGDAAFAGQGIGAELFNMSELDGYGTGGTLHFVINNQIGFTTSPHESRSGRYCTEIAKMVEAPIFHVNGDDPIALVRVMELALEYRQTFGSDVVVDMYCYRKYGHNESDEPAFTQPLLYKKIRSHPTAGKQLGEKLVAEGVLSADQVKALEKDCEDGYAKAFAKMKERSEPIHIDRMKKLEGSTARWQPEYDFKDIQTGVTKPKLQKIVKALTEIPADFGLNSKIKRQLATKKQAFKDGQGIDWAFAESLAFGTLLDEGTPVRLSGQDCQRGTFSQRHCVLWDSERQAAYVPLKNIDAKQATFCVHNSNLSEAAVLGFDYGYSLDYPEMLCMWEAQFGDFANGAQVIIDQFIVSSESKWQEVSGIVMLLPHGYEGQGPEHSSARLERYLQACAENNIQVCNLTTPAQYFHVLRRQMKRKYQKPLIIMTPKSLLRHKECVSSVDDLTKGNFQSILQDPEAPKKAKRVVLCSGKIFYDLLAHRRDAKVKDAAIVRIEQFYPLNEDKLQKLVGAHKDAKEIIWCQEEPKNMGAWSYIEPRLRKALNCEPRFVGRKPSASTATGSAAVHRVEQAHIVKTALEG